MNRCGDPYKGKSRKELLAEGISTIRDLHVCKISFLKSMWDSQTESFTHCALIKGLMLHFITE